MADSGSYNWAVPEVNSNQVLVRISGGGVSDVSDAIFTITWTAPASPTISGYVKTSGGAAIDGVSISADNGGGPGTTDASGFYSLTVPNGWSGTVTPGRTGYTFNPPSVSYTNVTTDKANQDYVGSPPVSPTMTISGYVKTSGGTAISGVSISADNGGGPGTTDTSGFYSLAVPDGWSGTVTPGRTGYTFNPPSASYTNVTTDKTNQDYVGTLTAFNVADHIYSLEILQVVDYNDPNIVDDLVYVFNFSVETDETVDLLEIISPSGTVFQIPKEAQTSSGTKQTWYYLNGATYLWEYEDTFTDAAGFDNYGDGTYTVTVYHSGGSQVQTSLWYGIPASNNAIPQPTQEPVLSFPENNSQTASPVEFTWQQCTDISATSIQLRLEDTSNAEAVIISFTTDETGSVPVALGRGTWEAKLSFNNSYQYSNVDGIGVGVSKYSESDYRFVVGLGVTGSTLLAEDFTDGDYSGWDIVDEGTYVAPSSWSAATGEMIQSSNIYSIPMTLANLATYAWFTDGTSWADYRTTLTISSDDNDILGLMFRYQDADNYYRFSWDRQRELRLLVKCVNGNFTLLAEDNVPYVRAPFNTRLSIQCLCPFYLAFVLTNIRGSPKAPIK